MAFIESLILRDATTGVFAEVTAANALKVDGSAVTQPVSVAALPLPSGAATQATLAALLTELQLKADLTDTQPVSVAALPLPSGAATAANQATEIASLASIDAGIPAALGQAAMAASMPVVIASNQSAVPVSGTVTVVGAGDATAANQVIGNASLASIDTKLTNPLPVSVASLPLPAGAATAANQVTEIASLASIDAGIPAALGQTTMAASMPVTMASNQSAIPVTSTTITDAIESLRSALAYLGQTINNPSYLTPAGDIRVINGGTAFSIGGTVAISTTGTLTVDSSFIMADLNAIEVFNYYQLISP